MSKTRASKGTAMRARLTAYQRREIERLNLTPAELRRVVLRIAAAQRARRLNETPDDWTDEVADVVNAAHDVEREIEPAATVRADVVRAE